MAQTFRRLHYLHHQQFLGSGGTLLWLVLSVAGCSPQFAEDLNTSAGGGSRTALALAGVSFKKDPADQACKLLRQAAAVLEQRPSVTAKIRHTVDLYGQQLVGAGSYWQMRNPDDEPGKVLSRLDLQLSVRERRASVRQICDGKFVWNDRKIPDAGKPEDIRDPEKGYTKRLTRIDLTEVVKLGEPPDEDHGAAAWGLSGLPRLLQNLSESFDFQPPRSEQIRQVPVWVIAGRWRRELQAELQSGDDAAPMDLTSLPPRAPDSVVISLGRDDLFPFRVIYRRMADDGSMVDVVKLELYEVRFNAPLEPQQFDYHSRKKFHDETPQFLKAYRARKPS